MERAEREVGIDSKHTLEQHCFCIYLPDGTLLMGGLKRHGDDPQSFVGFFMSQSKLS